MDLSKDFLMNFRNSVRIHMAVAVYIYLVWFENNVYHLGFKTCCLQFWILSILVHVVCACMHFCRYGTFLSISACNLSACFECLLSLVYTCLLLFVHCDTIILDGARNKALFEERTKQVDVEHLKFLDFWSCSILLLHDCGYDTTNID